MQSTRFDPKYLRLVTFTLDSEADHPAETAADRASRLMAAWRKFRHSSRWNQVSTPGKKRGYASPDYAWVLEFGSKNKRPHLHLIVYDPHGVVPLADAVDKYRSADDWLASQTPAAQKFYAIGRRFGLGWYHAEPVDTDGRGAANYMTKYLAKSVETSRLVDRRRRTFGTSKNWPRDLSFVKRFDIKDSVVIDKSRLLPISDHRSRSYASMDPITLPDSIESDIKHQLDGSVPDCLSSSLIPWLLDLERAVGACSSGMSSSDRQILAGCRQKYAYYVGSAKYYHISYDYSNKLLSDRAVKYAKLVKDRSDTQLWFRKQNNYDGSWRFVKYVHSLDPDTRDPFERLFIDILSRFTQVHLGKRSSSSKHNESKPPVPSPNQ